jgi:hypothetical protein
LYFLFPDEQRVEAALNELLLARIEERHIHVLARDGTDLHDLPPADPWHRSDLVHGMQQGLFVGGLTGALVGAMVVFFPPQGMAIGTGAVLGLAALGAIFGTWVAGLIGFDVPNTQLKGFQRAIDEGQILMMVDVPKERVKEISAMIRRLHPEADLRGSEPTIPAFP